MLSGHFVLTFASLLIKLEAAQLFGLYKSSNTVLQARMTRVRFPKGSLGFFTVLILSATLWP